MKIIPIAFSIATEELTNLSSEDVESSIRDEIMKHVIGTISPMLDDENFIEMSPSEDGSEYNISINIMIGAANEYIDATSATTTNLLALCNKQGVEHDASVAIIQEATKPLIDLVF
jgi:hypothetical protein